MSFVNPIKYVVNDTTGFGSEVPIVEVDSDGYASGAIQLTLPSLPAVPLSANVFGVTPPVSGQPKYIRTGLDLYAPQILGMDATTTGHQCVINWAVDPSAIPAAPGDMYSLEFHVAKFSPKVLINVKDKLL